MRAIIITINQDRFTTTHKHISEICPALKLERMEGIRGSNMTEEDRMKACSSNIVRPFMTDTMLGSASSHLMALRYFLECCEDAHIIIMEDDARLHRPFDDSIIRNMRDDLLHLGGFTTRQYHDNIICGNHDNATCGSETIAPVRFWICNTAYIISREGASKILQHLDHGGIMWYIDILFGLLVRRGIVSAGVVCDPIVYQDEEIHTTSTSASIGGSWIDQACRLISPDLQFATSIAIVRIPCYKATVNLSTIFEMLLATIIPVRVAVLFLALMLMGKDAGFRVGLSMLIISTVALFGSRARIFWVMIAGALVVIPIVMVTIAYHRISVRMEALLAKR